MGIVVNGLVGGICGVSLVLFPLMLIFDRGSKQKQDNSVRSPSVKRSEIIGLFVVGFAFMLASMIFAQQEAWNQRLQLGIEHIIVIDVIYVPD